MKYFLKLFILVSLSCHGGNLIKSSDHVLLFTKTSAFRHASIEAGIKTIKALGVSNNFMVTQTEDAAIFNNEQLKQFQVVIFLNTSGNILNSEQKQAFQIFIKNGGGFVGVHAASDTEHDWPWYGELVGAYFINHPKQATATLQVKNGKHQSTKHLKNNWSRWDEWYNLKFVNKKINVLLNLDETTYEGGTNSDYHPIAWYHKFDGGRSFYTGMGHTIESYDEPEFKAHLLGGILYGLKR